MELCFFMLIYNETTIIMKKNYTQPTVELQWLAVEEGIAISGGAGLQTLPEDEDYGSKFS